MKSKKIFTSPRTLVAPLVLSALLGAGMARPAHAQVALQDTFEDGNYTAAPVWRAMKGTWQVQDGAVFPAGDAEFSAIRTEDFTALKGGFQLSFEVKFRDTTANGRNRILVAVRDKSSKGYSIEITQGTANNTLISRLDPGTVNLSTTLLSPAFKFPTDAFVPVQFSKSPTGELKVTVNGMDYLKAQDNTYSDFGQLQLSSRSPDAQMVQGFDNIRLSGFQAQAALGTAAKATPVASTPARQWYKPAPAVWIAQEVDFTQYRKKPSSPLGNVVARGTTAPISFTAAQLLAPSNAQAVRLDLARGFQGETAAAVEAELATPQATVNLPTLAAGQYWMTARYFQTGGGLSGHKVFF